MGIQSKFQRAVQTPPVTRGLLVACALTWGLQQWVDGPGAGRLLGLLGLWPTAVLEHGAVWQLATHLFLHGPWWHILSNLLCLWSLGSFLERSIGPLHFGLLYAFSGLAGGIAHVAVYAGQGWPAVGASGAIMGVFAGLVALHRGSRFVLLFLPFVRIPGRVLLWIVLGLHLLWVLSGWDAAGLALEIHLAGLCAGWVYARRVFLPWARRRQLAPAPAAPPADDAADLLDRAARDGWGSLTREERARLGRG